MTRMKFAIFVMEDAAGLQPPINAWLKSCDFEARGGLGYAEMTHDPAKALRFESSIAALDYWKTRSRTNPTRPDGKPNRPLTAYTIMVKKLSD